MSGRLIAWLCLGVLTVGAAAQDARDYLKQDWYVTEMVLFQWTGQPADGEALETYAPRRYPLRVMPFSAAVDLATLDDDTRWQLEQPEFEMPVDAQPPEWLVAAEEDARVEAQTRADDTAQQQAVPAAPPPSPEEALIEAFAGFEADLAATSFVWSDKGLRLAAHARQLRRAPGFHVIHHGRWHQAVPDRDHPLPVLLQLGERHRDGLFEFEGTVAITLGRFLHADVRLWERGDDLPLEADALNRPDDASSLVAPGSVEGYLVLDESRRMRSEELHYIDHPRFGVLLRIDPVEIPQSLIQQVGALEEGG